MGQKLPVRRHGRIRRGSGVVYRRGHAAPLESLSNSPLPLVHVLVFVHMVRFHVHVLCSEPGLY